jgi:hypothetical protein
MMTLTARANVIIGSPLNCAPMIWPLLIIEMANTGYMGRMPILLRPIDRFLLGSESAERVIGMIFNDIIGNWTAFRSALWPRFDIHRRHIFFSYDTITGRLCQK